ncbi:MAG: M15 family metallopeptidase [Bdellovibrio sp.]
MKTSGHEPNDLKRNCGQTTSGIPNCNNQSFNKKRWEVKKIEMGTQFNAEPLETQNATFTDAQNISAEARKNRQVLMSAMSKAGFVNYSTEWWHWSFGDKYWAFHTNQPYAIFGSVEPI